MKSIIFFMLVGLSLGNEGVSVEVEEGTTEQMPSKCLMTAIQHCSPDLLTKLAKTLCMHRNEKETYSQQLIEDVKSVLKPYECTIQEVTGLNLEDTADNVLEIADHVSSCLEKALNSGEFITNVVDAVCNLLNPLLQDQCLKNIQAMVTKTTDSVLNGGVKKLLCGSEDQLDVSSVKTTLDSVTCTILEPLKKGPLNQVANSVDNLLKDLIQKLLGTIKNDPIIANVGKILCGAAKAIDDLLGKKPGGGGLLGNLL
ncbi:uncharacterized protein LOC134956772 [Pseudophryne corroboree]|uniref:uncharacterized protein LOC134956772 n=1 Tax=Pseudophryne corroboree TaxID=495146 RepID=UPI0030821AE7